VKTSLRIYRWLLRLYPRDFREEYGHEMSLLFRTRLSEGSVKLWLQVLGDLASHAPRERWSTMVRAAAISHALWQRVFNADRSLIGRTIRLKSNSYTLIGVAPPGFAGPVLGVATDVWVPTPLQPEVDPASAGLRRARGHPGKFDLRSSRGLRMAGRLPRGSSIEEVAARAEVIASRLRTACPNTNRNRRFILTPLGEGRGLRVNTRPVLRQLAGAVLMVLLVACANVASLLLSRAVSRQREVAVRIAIGASRARLVRQWLAEAVLLGVGGSMAALFVVWWTTPLLHTFVLPEAVDLSVNARVLGFTLSVGVGSGLLFGLAPAVQVLRRDTLTSLRAEGGAGATGARAARMRGHSSCSRSPSASCSSSARGCSSAR
jgi:FtsX-like permease family/MacB-like periplasmic core domain